MEELINAIQSVLDNPFADRGLPPMQERVALLSVQGQSIKTMAEELGISEDAIRKNRQYAARKIGIPTSQFAMLTINSIRAVLDKYRDGK